MLDAIILFGGVLLFVGLPLYIIGLMSFRREEQDKKQA
jgi:uncharacterized membrane protein